MEVSVDSMFCPSGPRLRNQRRSFSSTSRESVQTAVVLFLAVSNKGLLSTGDDLTLTKRVAESIRRLVLFAFFPQHLVDSIADAIHPATLMSRLCRKIYSSTGVL